MRRTTAMTVAATVALGLAASAPSAASAVSTAEEGAAAMPVVVDPVDGATLTAPVDEVTIDFTGAEPGTWFVTNTPGLNGVCGRLTCPGDTEVEVGAADGLRTVELSDPLVLDTDYTLLVSSERNLVSDDAARSTFTIEGEVDYGGVSQTNRTFSPLVQDRRRDRTRLSFTTSSGARPSVAVTGDGDAVIRRGGLTGDRAGGWTAGWDGRDAEGRLVEPGTYGVVVSTADAKGVVTRLRRNVIVQPARRTGRSRLAGEDLGALATSGRCTASTVGSRGGATLRCNDARRGFVRAEWALPIPDGARVTRFWVRGSEGPDGRGRITRSLGRIGSRFATVAVRVTGDRVIRVDDVNVAWRLPAGR